MNRTCLILILLALLPAPSAPPPRLSVSTDHATTRDNWTYTIAVERAMTVVDLLDTRLTVQGASPTCAVDASGVRVECAVEPAMPVTITVRIRRNACEPTLCRNIDWTILNRVWGRRQASNVVAVHVRSVIPSRPRRFVLWFPFTAGRSRST